MFNMAHMGLRLAQRANGVSKLHGEVSRDMFRAPVAGLRRHRGADRLGHQRRARPDVGGARDEQAARSVRVDTVTAHGIRHRRVRAGHRRGAVGAARRRCAAAWSTRCGAGCASRGCSAARRRWSWAGPTACSTPDVLTVGFARRVPTYKRLTLMLRDPERLRALLLHPERPGAARRGGQVAPGRRRRQGADPADRALRRRGGRAAPDRVPARLRHVHGPVPVLGLRRVAEQPDAPARGVRHVRHEVGAERRPQPVHPRRLVGRAVRRLERLGHPDRGRRQRPGPPRRPGGQRPVRAARSAGRAAVLRPRRGRRADPLDVDGPAHAGLARPGRAGLPHGPRVRGDLLRAGRRVRAERRR